MRLKCTNRFKTPRAQQVLRKPSQYEDWERTKSQLCPTSPGSSGDCLQQKRGWEGAHLCEVGVPGVEDCGPEPSIEGDLRREVAGECGAPRWGRPPQRAHIHLTLGKGIYRAEKHASPGPWSPWTGQARAPPPPPSPGPSGSASHHPEPPRPWGLQPPQVPAWPGNQFQQSQVPWLLSG